MMKSRFAFVAVAILAASFTFAQSNRQLRANIPFDFTAGGNALPAGEYYVRISYSPSSISVQKTDGTKSVAVLSHAAAPNGRADTASLVFNVYGDRYFLSRVYTSGADAGEELPRSHAELEQVAARHALKTITVAASLR